MDVSLATMGAELQHLREANQRAQSNMRRAIGNVIFLSLSLSLSFSWVSDCCCHGGAPGVGVLCLVPSALIVCPEKPAIILKISTIDLKTTRLFLVALCRLHSCRHDDGPPAPTHPSSQRDSVPVQSCPCLIPSPWNRAREW